MESSLQRSWLASWNCTQTVSSPSPNSLLSPHTFALIPSRDEPFGLVAVEFGRKGVFGVGSQLGGLVLMPGWVSELPSEVILQSC